MFNFKEAGIVGSVLTQVLHFQLINKDKTIPGVLPFNSFFHICHHHPVKSWLSLRDQCFFCIFVFYRSDQRSDSDSGH